MKVLLNSLVYILSKDMKGIINCCLWLADEICINFLFCVKSPRLSRLNFYSPEFFFLCCSVAQRKQSLLQDIKNLGYGFLTDPIFGASPNIFYVFYFFYY